MDSHDYVIRKPSSSASLGDKKFKKGESVSVPSDLDITKEIKPFAGLQMAGVVVLAWENATTRDSVITQAYRNAADMIDEYIDGLVTKALAEVLAATPLDEIEVEVSETDIACLQADIESTIRTTIRDGSNLWQAIPDHDIGNDHAIVSLKDPIEQCLRFSFKKGSTHYTLEGDLSYGIPRPSRGASPPGPRPSTRNRSPRPSAS